ncbi:hypothetical protein ScPMuIL_010452 [Solemya velum]
MSVSLTDEGQYVCEAQNYLGQIQSPWQNLVVARLEIDFQQDTEDVFGVAGLPATIECTPPISVPPAVVTWYKDNHLLVERDGEFAVSMIDPESENWKLHFVNVQKNDEGEYFCVATNNFSVPTTRTSRVAYFKVGGAPSFVQPPQGSSVVLESMATLVCLVEGDPPPVIQWLFEDRVLEPSQDIIFSQNNGELRINNINKAMEGTYMCRAKNSYGEKEAVAFVKVLVPPVVTVHIGELTVSAGTSILIPCEVYGDPTPDIKWYKDGNALTLSNSVIQNQDGLYLSSVAADDSGTYTCKATNMVGDAQSVGSLTVQVSYRTEHKDKFTVVLQEKET